MSDHTKLETLRYRYQQLQYQLGDAAQMLADAIKKGNIGSFVDYAYSSFKSVERAYIHAQNAYEHEQCKECDEWQKEAES